MVPTRVRCSNVRPIYCIGSKSVNLPELVFSYLSFRTCIILAHDGIGGDARLIRTRCYSNITEVFDPIQIRGGVGPSFQIRALSQPDAPICAQVPYYYRCDPVKEADVKPFRRNSRFENALIPCRIKFRSFVSPSLCDATSAFRYLLRQLRNNLQGFR